MQEAGFKTYLIAAALAASACAAQATPVELPLEQADAFLRDAGVVSAWSVQQFHSERAPTIWAVSAYSGRETLGENLCATQFVELQVKEKDAKLSLDRSVKRTKYAFEACAWAMPEDFHDIRGKLDPVQMEEDFAAIVAAIRNAPPPGMRIAFADEKFREPFRALRRNDISTIDADHQGHLQICFISGLVDELGAMETLSIEVVRGKQVEVKVDLCGTIEVTRDEK